MAITFEKLQERMKAQGLRYFIAPDAPMLRLGVTGLFGTYEIAVMLLDDGQFLQFRTVNYHSCPRQRPHLDAVLRLLALINFQKRLVKFGWDPSDGEIMAYADLWIMDGDATQDQFARLLANFLPSIDLTSVRIAKVLETGEDPGEIDQATLMARLAEGGGGDKGGAPAGTGEKITEV
jgi:hypothetical protein